MDPLAHLAGRWRDDAAVVRRCGHEDTARLLESCAAEVDAAFRGYLVEELSAAQAAEATGYTADYLSDLARDGKVLAVKTGTGWTFRRCDLPRKPSLGPHRSPVDELAEQLLAGRSR